MTLLYYILLSINDTDSLRSCRACRATQQVETLCILRLTYSADACCTLVLNSKGSHEWEMIAHRFPLIHVPSLINGDTDGFHYRTFYRVDINNLVKQSCLGVINCTYQVSFTHWNEIDKCRERDSNPHSHSWPRDFKSLVSTIPPSRLTGCKITEFICNHQISMIIY